MPGSSVPSRSKNLTPRKWPTISITGSAPEERISACNIGGTSGSASLTASWLKPQLTHSISIRAMAPGGSPCPTLTGRVTLAEIAWVDMFPRGPAYRPVVMYSRVAWIVIASAA